MFTFDGNPKAAALKCLAPFSVKYAGPNKWYIEQGVEIGGDGMLLSPLVQGSSPEDAINLYWDKITNLGPGFWLTTEGLSKDRRKLRWNGAMWDDVV